METRIIDGRRQMPRTSDTAMRKTRQVLAEAQLRPAGFSFGLNHVSTGKHLDRVLVLLPIHHFDEGQTWLDKLAELLPWSCRLTLVPEIGRIEIEPRR
jgi:hypothetical protein